VRLQRALHVAVLPVGGVAADRLVPAPHHTAAEAGQGGCVGRGAPAVSCSPPGPAAAHAPPPATRAQQLTTRWCAPAPPPRSPSPSTPG
jgi:hypothetical protein